MRNPQKQVESICKYMMVEPRAALKLFEVVNKAEDNWRKDALHTAAIVGIWALSLGFIFGLALGRIGV